MSEFDIPSWLDTQVGKEVTHLGRQWVILAVLQNTRPNMLLLGREACKCVDGLYELTEVLWEEVGHHLSLPTLVG